MLCVGEQHELPKKHAGRAIFPSPYSQLVCIQYLQQRNFIWLIVKCRIIRVSANFRICDEFVEPGKSKAELKES